MQKIAKGLMVLLVSAGLTSAHNPPGELFFLFQFPDNAVPTIDGDLSDWSVVPDTRTYVIRSDRLYDPAQFHAAGRGELDLSDFNPLHILGWNENFNKLYFANQVFDNIHNTDREDPARHWDDDNWEVEVNPTHLAADEQNLSDEPVNRIAYKWVVPPLEGVYQSLEPIGNLAWLSDGGDFTSFGWSFDGDQFGESTYYYELGITPIAEIPREGATPENIEIYDLEEEDIIHISINNGDIDAPQSDHAYQGFWGTTPESSNIALNDFVLAPLEEGIDFSAAETGVEATSWGQLKSSLGR